MGKVVVPITVFPHTGSRRGERLEALGEAKLKVNGHTLTSRVMFGKPHDATVLGLVVLESLGLTVDPSKGEIVKGEALLLGVSPERVRG